MRPQQVPPSAPAVLATEEQKASKKPSSLEPKECFISLQVTV